jgi:hypothetical protein
MKNLLQEASSIPGPNQPYVPSSIMGQDLAAQLLVNCREKPELAEDSLESIRLAFQHAAPCTMKQAWLTTPEIDFSEGLVWTGWRENSLLVFAELTDTDIFSPSTSTDYATWEAGDVFEIFLRPLDQMEYVEFHVTPENRRLQLRFANPAMVEQVRKTRSVESVLMQGDAFRSLTWVQPKVHKWFVYAEIPASSVCSHLRPLKESQWHFSFSRYDYIRGRKSPVISSTSPHVAPDFHRQHEWGLLSFQR